MLHATASPVNPLPEMETKHREKLSAGPGSWDHAVPTDQMRAIDMAMCWYFESEDWLDERAGGAVIQRQAYAKAP